MFLQTQQNIKMIFFSLLNSSTFSEFLWSINLRYILKQWDNKCPTNSKYILDDSSNLTMQRGPRSMFRPHVQVSWRRSSCFVFSNHSMRNQNYLLRQWHIDHCFRTIGSHNTTIPHSIKRSTDFLLFFQLECHHCRKWIVFFFYAHEIQKRVERPVKWRRGHSAWLHSMPHQSVQTLGTPLIRYLIYSTQINRFMTILKR